METYLTTTSANLKSGNYRNLTIVIGNESCDLDSAVSAIVYAAFLYWQYSQLKCKVCTRESRDETTYHDDVFVPILNVDRKDYELKTEVAFCLKQHGIDASKLVFRDDLDLERVSDKASVILVDHHELAARDRFLAPKVIEVIDHRPLQRDNWMFEKDTRTSIELVGSCCTMVAQRVRDLSKLTAAETSFFTAYTVAADLLHSGIVLDTVNFSKEVKKATPLDEEMAVFLESILKPDSYEAERKRKLDRLVAARNDVSSLSAPQLLRKDAKLAGDALVPSLPILVEEFFLMEGALLAVCEEVKRRGCSVAVLLGMALGDTLRRDVAIVHADDALANRLASHLEEWKAPPLQLVLRELAYASANVATTAHAPTVVYFTQLNLSASRKQYMPAIINYQQKNKSPNR